MSVNKNALIRYKVLDKCFRNPGRNFFIDDLIDECNKILTEIDQSSNGISRRQIFEDIKFMESDEGWNINLFRKREGKRVYYRYEDMSYSINNVPLNDVEINHLKEAMDLLSHFNGMPQFEWINEIIPKLQQGIKPAGTSDVIMEFDSNQYLKGIEYLGLLYNAIIYKRVLMINYKPYEADKPYDIVFHPHFLKQYNNRWFLFGYNPAVCKHDWNLAIDRMIDIKETNEKYVENDSIDWNEYFDDIIGVTKPENAKPEKIVLHFFGKTCNYIDTKPLHGSQKSKRLSKDVLEVRLDLIINYELERLILSYAGEVKVISPDELKYSIAKKLKSAAMQY